MQLLLLRSPSDKCLARSAVAAYVEPMPDPLQDADAFLRSWTASTKKQRLRLQRKAPLPALHYAALHHPDAESR